MSEKTKPIGAKLSLSNNMHQRHLHQVLVLEYPDGSPVTCEFIHFNKPEYNSLETMRSAALLRCEELGLKSDQIKEDKGKPSNWSGYQTPPGIRKNLSYAGYTGQCTCYHCLDDWRTSQQVKE